MGHYTICSICGLEEKGYTTSCECEANEMKKVIQSRVGATLVETFVNNEYQSTSIYEHWQKDCKDFYMIIIMSRDDCIPNSVLSIGYEEWIEVFKYT